MQYVLSLVNGGVNGHVDIHHKDWDGSLKRTVRLYVHGTSSVVLDVEPDDYLSFKAFNVNNDEPREVEVLAEGDFSEGDKSFNEVIEVENKASLTVDNTPAPHVDSNQIEG